MSSVEELGKELEIKLFEIASKNKEIKKLKEELEKLKEPNGLKKLEETSQKLKELTKKDQKEIDDLLNQIFEMQTKVSKQTEDMRLLKEENEKLKKNELGGKNNISGRKANIDSGFVPDEPLEGEDSYNIIFQYNSEYFDRRFYGVNTIGQVKAYIKKKLGVNNKIKLFTVFPRIVYDNDSQKLQDSGLLKNDCIKVAIE